MIKTEACSKFRDTLSKAISELFNIQHPNCPLPTMERLQKIETIVNNLSNERIIGDVCDELYNEDAALCNRFFGSFLDTEIREGIIAIDGYIYDFTIGFNEKLKAQNLTDDEIQAYWDKVCEIGFTISELIRLLKKDLVSLGLIEAGQPIKRQVKVIKAEQNVTSKTQPIDNLKLTLPSKLDREDFVSILNKAISKGFCKQDGNKYKWLKEIQLCAYFADVVSHKLNLSTKIDNKGNVTTDWKSFEELFGFPKEKRQLSTAKANWMRVNTTFYPNGFEEIDELVK